MAVTRWVCRWCIATKGLRGADLKNWPAIDDEEAQLRHIESEHHISVRREGETEDQALARFRREQPEAGGPNCHCPSCTGARDIQRLVEWLIREQKQREAKT